MPQKKKRKPTPSSRRKPAKKPPRKSGIVKRNAAKEKIAPQENPLGKPPVKHEPLSEIHAGKPGMHIRIKRVSVRVIEELLRAACTAMVVVFAIVTYEATTLRAREDPEATADFEGQHFSTRAPIGVSAPLVNPFSDEVPDWGLASAVQMNELGIVRGYENGQFGAGDSVTRGQVVTLIQRILLHLGLIEEPERCTQEFNDVPEDHYAFAPACLFLRHGWTNPEDAFFPNDPAPRGVTAAFMDRVFGRSLLNASGVEVSVAQVFDDVPVDHPFFGNIAVMNATGIMTGYPNGLFGADDELDRTSAAVIMERILRQVTSAVRMERARSGRRPGDPPGTTEFE